MKQMSLISRRYIFSGAFSLWLLAVVIVSTAAAKTPALPVYVVSISGPPAISAAAHLIRVRVAVANAGAMPTALPVKVKFFFEDKPETHWMRVMQLPRGGSMMLPRVGWEVDVTLEFGKDVLRVGNHRLCVTTHVDDPVQQSDPPGDTGCFDFVATGGTTLQANVRGVAGATPTPTWQPLVIPSFQPQTARPIPSFKASFGPQCLGGEYHAVGELCSSSPCEPSTASPQPCGPPETCPPGLFGPCAPRGSAAPSIVPLKASQEPEQYERIEFKFATIQLGYPSPSPSPTATPSTRVFYYPLPERPSPTPMAKAGPQLFGPGNAKAGGTVLVSIVIPSLVAPEQAPNEFDVCLISEVRFPALDASSKDACAMSIKLRPEYPRWASPSPPRTLQSTFKLTVPKSTPAGAHLMCPFIPFDARFQSHPGDASACARIQVASG